MLHKIALDIDLGDTQVESFIALQGASLALAIMPEPLVDDVADSLGTSVLEVNQGKQLFINVYKDALTEGVEDGWITSLDLGVPGALDLAAAAVLDSILFAGGASVASIIRSGLRAYYTGLADGINTTNSVDLSLLALESIRVYPAVLGFPYIEASTGIRHIPLPGFAGYDTKVYGKDASNFRIRGDLAYYHQRSLNFADSALPVSPSEPSTARICPGRSLSLVMITTFWEALYVSQFCVEGGLDSIQRDNVPSFWSDFNLTKTCA